VGSRTLEGEGMKNSQIADINSSAFIIAACFSHGYLAIFLSVLTVLEMLRYVALKRLGQ
jgi:hypothetical protein